MAYSMMETGTEVTASKRKAPCRYSLLTKMMSSQYLPWKPSLSAGVTVCARGRLTAGLGLTMRCMALSHLTSFAGSESFHISMSYAHAQPISRKVNPFHAQTPSRLTRNVDLRGARYP
eukprot:1816737-Rhodomonas_salina.1